MKRKCHLKSVLRYWMNGVSLETPPLSVRTSFMNEPNFCLDCDFWLPLPLFKTILLLALPQLLPIGFAFSDFYLYTARWFYGLMHTFRCVTR